MVMNWKHCWKSGYIKIRYITRYEEVINMEKLTCLVKFDARPRKQYLWLPTTGRTKYTARDNLLSEIHEDTSRFVNLRAEILECEED